MVAANVSKLQLYLVVAGVALATYVVTSRACYSKCMATSNVQSALGSMSQFTNDQLLARIAVLSEESEKATRQLSGLNAQLRTARDHLKSAEADADDQRAFVIDLQARVDGLTTRVAMSEAKETTCLKQLDALVTSKNLRQQDVPAPPPPPPPPAEYDHARTAAECPPQESGSTSFTWGKIPGMPRCTGPPALTGPKPTQSHVQCFQSSDWAEICVYDLLCTDGNKPVLVNDNLAGREAWGHWGVGDDASGYHVFDVYPRPPPPSKDIPLNSRARPYYVSSSALANAEWTDRSMWMIEPEYRTWEMQHLFFFSHGVFPMWEAQFSNASWGGSIPPIQDVFYMVKAKYHFNDWNTQVLDVIVPKTGTVHYMDDLEPYSKDKLLCTRRGVLAGNKPNLFSGMRTADAFRAATYKKYGIVMPKQPPKKLVIFNRANAGRRFENMDEMEALFKRYSIPYTVVSKHGSFENQVRTMSSAGVLILAHGAAATNTMFQPHRSVIVEVFPYLRKRFGFKTVADTIGNFYMPIYSFDKPQTGKDIMNKTEWLTNCENISGIKTNRVGICDQAQKVVTIRVDIATLERTLIDAFDIIGYRISAAPKDTKRQGGWSLDQEWEG